MACLSTWPEKRARARSVWTKTMSPFLPARFASESVRLNERDGLGLLLYFSLIVTILCVNFFNSEGFDAEAVESWRSGGEGLRDAATESVRLLRKTFTPRPSCRVDFFSINAC